MDRVGLPVWQAVRPRGRALSVHQGKGATNPDAQLGALLEAVESDCAEQFTVSGPECRLDSLPAYARADCLSDFSRRREISSPADEPLRWAEARDLLTGHPLYIPFLVASLDFTHDPAPHLDRSSNGVATGATRDEAVAVALQELIERDAVIEWKAKGMVRCTASTLRLETVPFDWLHFWVDRLRSLEIAIRFSWVPSMTGSPVFVCELSERRQDIAAYHLNAGYACHAEPEIALFKAFSEAVQGRATYVAGAREDLFWHYSPAPGDQRLFRFGLPLASGMAGITWDSVAPGPRGPGDLADRLAAAGYGRIAVLDLGVPEGLHVVRTFVLGLGSASRRRRVPS